MYYGCGCRYQKPILIHGVEFLSDNRLTGKIIYFPIGHNHKYHHRYKREEDIDGLDALYLHNVYFFELMISFNKGHHDLREVKSTKILTIERMISWHFSVILSKNH